MGTDNLFHKQKAKIDRGFERRDAKRAPYARILIVCEGKKTEPNYFEGLKHELKLNSANVEIAGGNDSSPTKIAEIAKKRYRQEKKNGYPFDKVYCVIDKDQHPGYANALKQIMDMDKNMKPRKVFHAIPSVPCFEYFLLLHFNYTTKPLANYEQAESELKKHLPDYQKGDKNIFASVRDHLETAKTNAAKSLAEAERNETDNPSTRAHELVKFMQSIRRKP